MRKLISSIHLTLDGFCDHTAAIIDEQINQAAIRMLEGSGTLLLGSATFRLFEGFWPEMAASGKLTGSFMELARLLDEIEKVVFSRTEQKTTWKNARWIGGNITEAIWSLKQQPGKDILSFGSPGLLNQLINRELIDEYRLYVQPIILGKGVPFSVDIAKRVDLELVGRELLDSGATGLTFKHRSAL